MNEDIFDLRFTNYVHKRPDTPVLHSVGRVANRKT
jgi:hypothetical protein